MAFALKFPAKSSALAALWRTDPSSQTQWGSFVQVQSCVRGRWRPTRSLAQSEFRSSPAAARAFLATVEREWRVAFLLNADALGARLLSIPAQGPDGFDIEVTIDGEHIRASFGGLVQEFASVSHAFQWVTRALSSAYRLRIGTLDGLPHEWRLEPVNAGAGATEVLASGSVRLSALWKMQSVLWRQNRLDIGSAVSDVTQGVASAA